MDAAQESLVWVLDLYEDQYSPLYGLVRLLGAGDQSGTVVRQAFLSLHSRSRRMVDPQERVEYLREQVVHGARAVGGPFELPEPDDGRYTSLIRALRDQPRHTYEILVVSHALGIFGPELARVMRRSVRTTNRLLEASLAALEQALESESGTDGQIDARSQELAEALRSSLRQIRIPTPEPIEEELRSRRAHRSRGGMRGQMVAVASISALAIGALTAVGTQRPPDPGPLITPTSAAPTPKASAPVALQAVVRNAPVYFVGRSDGRLYQESRSLPATSNLARAGVESLFTLVPKDPDYRSLWQGQVLKVERRGEIVTVDLSTDSYAQIAGPDVTSAIDQMVYTVTDLLQEDGLRIQFKADGHAPPAGFASEAGHTRRGLTPMPGVWITSPANQSVAPTGLLQITGTSRPELGAPVVTISDRDSQKPVASAIAQTSLTQDARGWLAWTVSVSMTEPGIYEVVARPQGDRTGATPPPASSVDTKVVRIERR